MCGTTPPDTRQAAAMLADFINREFGARATAADVRRVIRDKWGAVSGLAHAVHDEVRHPRFNDYHYQ